MVLFMNWRGRRELAHDRVTIGCAGYRGSTEEERCVFGDDFEEEGEPERM